MSTAWKVKTKHRCMLYIHRSVFFDLKVLLWKNRIQLLSYLSIFEGQTVFYKLKEFEEKADSLIWGWMAGRETSSGWILCLKPFCRRTKTPGKLLAEEKHQPRSAFPAGNATLIDSRRRSRDQPSLHQRQCGKLSPPSPRYLKRGDLRGKDLERSSFSQKGLSALRAAHSWSALALLAEQAFPLLAVWGTERTPNPKFPSFLRRGWFRKRCFLSPLEGN